MMPIKYEKIDITEKSEGLFNITVKIIIDNFKLLYEKPVTLEYRPDRPEVYEKNLVIQTDIFIADIKKKELTKTIDISTSLDKVSLLSNEKHKDIAKAVTG